MTLHKEEENDVIISREVDALMITHKYDTECLYITLQEFED